MIVYVVTGPLGRRVWRPTEWMERGHELTLKEIEWAKGIFHDTEMKFTLEMMEKETDFNESLKSL